MCIVRALHSRLPLCALLLLLFSRQCLPRAVLPVEARWWDEGATTVPPAAWRQLESATRQKEVVDRGRKCIDMVSFGTAATRRSRRGNSSRVHLCPLQLVLCGSGRVRERGRPRVSQAGGLASVRQEAGQRGGEVAPPGAVPDPSSRQRKPHRLAVGGGTARHHLRRSISWRGQAGGGDFGWLRVCDPGQSGWLVCPSAQHSTGAVCSKPLNIGKGSEFVTLWSSLHVDLPTPVHTYSSSSFAVAVTYTRRYLFSDPQYRRVHKKKKKGRSLTSMSQHNIGLACSRVSNVQTFKV